MKNVEVFILTTRGEPRLELVIHVFGIMWNYFENMLI